MISRTPGVGKKVAERIASELKDKVPAFATIDPALARLQGERDGSQPTAAADAVSALVNLGYGASQAGLAVTAALRKAGQTPTTEVLIRTALQELAR
jgi:Holliday junction DNA helicase RuvA